MLEPVIHATTVFTCRNEFDAMMTCIYDAWAARLGHSNIRLMTEPVGDLELFCTYRHIEADRRKTQSVIRSICRKISSHAYRMVYQAAMSDEEDKLDAIYRFLVIGFHYGSAVTGFLQEPPVMRLMELARKTSNEAHSHREFIRFSNMEHNVLVGCIEPKCDVLTLIAPHFADRMPSENWMIIDLRRMTAVAHPCDTEYYLTSLTPEETERLSKPPDDPFTDLWRIFFDSITIKERKNLVCQRNLLPLWYRKHMPEFPVQ